MSRCSPAASTERCARSAGHQDCRGEHDRPDHPYGRGSAGAERPEPAVHRALGGAVLPGGAAAGGNVFADLGVDTPEEALAKAELTAKIAQVIEAKSLTQAAARVLGIDQPKVSALLRGKLTGFSTERLVKFLNALGRDVEIVIRDRPRARGPGHLRVLVPRSEAIGERRPERRHYVVDPRYPHRVSVPGRVRGAHRPSASPQGSPDIRALGARRWKHLPRLLLLG